MGECQEIVFLLHMVGTSILVAPNHNWDFFDWVDNFTSPIHFTKIDEIKTHSLCRVQGHFSQQPLQLSLRQKRIEKSKDHFLFLGLQFIDLQDAVQGSLIQFFFCITHQIIEADLEGVGHALGDVDGGHGIVAFVAPDDLPGHFYL